MSDEQTKQKIVDALQLRIPGYNWEVHLDRASQFWLAVGDSIGGTITFDEFDGLPQLLAAVESIPLPAPPAPAGREDEDAKWLRLRKNASIEQLFSPEFDERIDRIAARLESHAALEAERDRLLGHVLTLTDDAIYVRVNQIHEELSQPGMPEYRMAEEYLDAADAARRALRPPQTEAEE